MLSNDVISALLPGTKNRKLYDGKGLYMLVTPTGGKLWRLKYYFPQRTTNNKEKLLALGSYPEVPPGGGRSVTRAGPVPDRAC
jgi:hypothetical protein